MAALTVDFTVDQHQQMIWYHKSFLIVEISHWTSNILCISLLPPVSGTSVMFPQSVMI